MQQQKWEPKRYLINQKWWSQWCDYVNFDAKISLDNSCDINLLPKQSLNDSPETGEQLAKHNRKENQNSHDWDELDTSREGKSIPPADSEDSNDVSQLYEKPPRIINIHLLDPFIAKGQKQRLKSNLIEHFDFEALYPSVWKHFYSWYSADVQIVRSLKKDVLNRHVMILDLYPDSEQQ